MPDKYGATERLIQHYGACKRLQTLNAIHTKCDKRYGEMYNIYIAYTHEGMGMLVANYSDIHDNDNVLKAQKTLLRVNHAEYKACLTHNIDRAIDASMLQHSMSFETYDTLPYDIQQALAYAFNGQLQHVRNMLAHSLSIYRLSHETVVHNVMERAQQTAFCLQSSDVRQRAIVPKELVNTTVTLHDFNLVRLHFNSDCEDFCVHSQVFHKRLRVYGTYDMQKYNFSEAAGCRLILTNTTHENNTHDNIHTLSMFTCGQLLPDMPYSNISEHTHDKTAITSQTVSVLSAAPVALLTMSMMLLVMSLCYAQMKYSKYTRNCCNAISKFLRQL